MAFDSTLFQSYSVSISSDYAQTYVYNAGEDDLTDVYASGYFNDLLYRVTTGDKLLVKTETSGLSFSGTFRNDGTNVYVDWDRTYFFQDFISDVSTSLDNSYICVPAGIITQVGGTLNTPITVANATVTFNISGTPVTGATLVFTPAMSAGTRVVATPTAANIVAAAGTVQAISDGGSTTASRGNFFVKMICPSQV